MNIEVRWKGVEKSEELKDHVHRRAEMALDRLAPRIRKVLVRFEDTNGARGGLDKSCRVEIFGDFGSRTADARDSDFKRAANRALAIVSRSTMHALRRSIGMRNDPVDGLGTKRRSTRPPEE